ncbi:unnamed protein product [Rodentolepis nana]|uniref:Antigen B n=1 Tax=Rodentolepis nana TaxID=102285 RepID=A0A0R3TB12_RODNA|nr:unnamed protein product [Rodentolepis nana]
MRTFCLIALVVLALVAVTQADEENVDFKRTVMMKLAEVKKFFSDDPAGKKLREIAMDVGIFGKMMRMKIRGALKEYVKNLLKEGQ